MVRVQIYFLSIFLLLTSSISAQTFTSSGSGDWDIGTTWGGGCTSGCTEGVDFPGVSNDVDITSGSTITIPSGMGATCNSLVINSDKNNSQTLLTLADASTTLTVTNDVAVQSASVISASVNHIIQLNGGTLDIGGNLYMDAEETGAEQPVLFSVDTDSEASFNAGTESNRLMVVSVSGEEDGGTIGTIVDIKYGSTSLTQRASLVAAGNRTRTEIWTLSEAEIEAEGSVAAFTVTWDTDPQSELFHATVFYNVDQDNPVGSIGSDWESNNNTLATGELCVNLNDVLFYATNIRASGGSDHTADTGFTELFDNQVDGNSFSFATAYAPVASSGLLSATAAWNKTASLAIMGIVLKSNKALTALHADGSESTSKVSYDTGSESNRLLVVSVTGESVGPAIVGEITDIKYGNTSLTQRVAISGSSVDRIRTEIWTLSESDIAAEGTLKNFTVTWNDPPENGEIFHVSRFYKVNQTNPVGSTDDAVDASNFTISLSGLSVNKSDVSFYASSNRKDVSAHTAPAGYAEILDAKNGEVRMATAYKTITADGVETPTATWSQAGALTIAGLAIHPEAVEYQSSGVLASGGTISVAGDILLNTNSDEANASISLIGGSSTLKIGGEISEINVEGTGQRITTTSSSVFEYSGSGDQTIQTQVGSTAITSIGTLTLSGSGMKTLEGDLTVNDNLRMEGTSSFNNGGNTLSYGASAVVTYAGNNSQTTGDELPAVIGGLEIDNNNNVTLNTDLTVDDDISFLAGKLILGSSDVIANGTISGYNHNRYFVTNGSGFLERDAPAGTTVEYPVGISTTSKYNLVELTPGDVSTFQVSVDDTFNNAPEDPDNIVNAEWNINRTAGSAATTVSLTWRDDGSVAFGSTFDVTDELVRIGYWSGGWTMAPTASKDDVGPEYSIEAQGMTIFSSIGIGSDIISLPVKLLYFDAEWNQFEEIASLEWATASELNNDSFTIEKSFNGTDFFEIGKVSGNGTTNNFQAYDFVDSRVGSGAIYYRLKQTDYDGKFEYLGTKKINTGFGSSLKIYPSHVSNEPLNIVLDEFSDKDVQLEIVSLTGAVMFSRKLEAGEIGNKVSLNLNHLRPGCYLVNLNARNRKFQSKFIKK